MGAKAKRTVSNGARVSGTSPACTSVAAVVVARLLHHCRYSVER